MAEPVTRTTKPQKPLGLVASYEKPHLTVCGGHHPELPCGSFALYTGLKKEVERRNLPLHLEPAKIGCRGTCQKGPFVSLPRLGLFYQQVQTGHIPYILNDTLLQGKILFPILRLDPLQSIRSDLIWEKETECFMTLDSSYCMVQTALYLIQFHAEESCGKCVPCRLGIKRLGEVLEAMTRGRAGVNALQEIETLISLMTQAAYCSFAGKASQIVLAIMHYFREEFQAHLREKHCPAGACGMM
jgi:(2Fe-2S) ferredoxin